MGFSVNISRHHGEAVVSMEAAGCRREINAVPAVYNTGYSMVIGQTSITSDAVIDFLSLSPSTIVKYMDLDVILELSCINL